MRTEVQIEQSNSISTAAATARWLLAVVGGAIVVALQTPPETAASNAALWIEKITGRLPDLPPWVDALGTAFGFILILTPIAVWLRKGRRKRVWNASSLEGLNRVMSGAGKNSFADHARQRSLRNKAEIVADLSSDRHQSDDVSVARQKNESAHTRDRALQNESPEWVPLHHALYYLVYESNWAANQPTVETEEEFNRVVSAEVRERVARGDIATRGQLGWDEESRQRATEPIPAKYWIDAFFLPYPSIALGASGGDEIAKQGGGGNVYRGVIARWPDVEKTWIGRRSREVPLTPLASFVDEARSRVAAERVQSSSRGILAAREDELSEQKDRAFRRMADILIPERSQKICGDRYRDATLAEALGWVVNGEWGKPWHGTPLTAALGSALGVGSNIYELLAEFSERAGDAKLTIWGKPSNLGVWQLIPSSHWKDHQLQLADTFGGITSGKGGYYDLMLNRAQVESEWPHAG